MRKGHKVHIEGIKVSDQIECTRTERVVTGIGTWEGSQAFQSVVKGSQNMPKTENGKEPDKSKKALERYCEQSRELCFFRYA